MAIIAGTAANDVLVGTINADRIEGAAGNDRINSGAGDDEIFGGDGSDILTGDAGNDRIFGEDGNDGVYGGGGNDYIDGGLGDDVLIGDGGNDHILGGAGNDKLFGGTGNDRLEGGAGNDILTGEAGDDVFVYRTGDGSDTIVGGQGSDRIELDLTGADVTEGLRADLAAFQAWSAAQVSAAGSAANLAAQTTGATFTFASLGLTVSNVEGLSISVDGHAVALEDFINRGPEAAAEANHTVAEDGVLAGIIAASDADGDALSYVVETGPANGSVTLDPADGSFVYTAAGNASGADTFTVRISDPTGASAVQVVSVAVTAVADAPDLAVSDAVVTLRQPVVGTEVDDVLEGDGVPASAPVALDVAAVLRDLDGSETLSVRIAGVPAGGELSAGAVQPDGTWLLQASDLAGLTLTAPTASDLTLTVTALATEAAGDVATATRTLQVTFDHTGLGDDTLIGAGGHDLLLGHTGDDHLDGGAGNDRLEGGAGRDVLDGGAGDDMFVVVAGEGGDAITGGEGHDVVALQLAAADVGEALLAEIRAYKAWSAGEVAAAGSRAAFEGQATGDSFAFASLGLTVSTIDELSITVDGAAVWLDALINRAPVAATETTVSVAEDGVLNGTVVAHDADGDALSFAVAAGPARGTLALDEATGAFVYTPVANASGADAFTVRVTDAWGSSTVQVVNVAVAAVADRPTQSTANATVSLVRPITGTSGNDVLKGDQYAATATVALAVSAGLADRDGSETLAVRIAGVPAGGVLSAGILQSDGTWLLAASHLAGLTMTAPTASDITLHVTSIATEAAGASASVTDTLQVTFDRGGFNDTFIADAGNDTYDGGAGVDTIDFSNSATAVRVDLSRFNATGYGNDTIRNIECVIGTSKGDRLTGDNAANVLDGGAGDDRIDGGNGNDSLIGGSGNDVYDGGNGNDTLDFSRTSSAITIDIQRGSVSSIDGTFTSWFSGIETYVGSRGDDVFLGSKGVDVVVGGDGDDTFRGFEGADVFTGGAGGDTFLWQTKDVVQGKKALGPDIITDFAAGDVLDVSMITGGAAVDNAVRITDTAAGSMMAVKVSGSFVDVALLENVHGITAAGLAADGWLIV